MKYNPKVIVVLGPTATGKSDLAVNIAKHFNGEIISADSRQVFKGMDLGSGKITKEEMMDIPHYMLDIVKPNTYFSVAKYKKKADEKIEKIISRNKIPIICGGTGFYIDTVVKNVSLPEVPPNQKLRKNLEKKTADFLFKLLQKLDPERAKNIDRKNKVRLIRAIEISKMLGSVPKIVNNPSKYHFIFIGLDTKDQILKDRISLRLIKRIEAGMIEEIQKLHKNGVSWRRLESFGLEYRQTALFLQGKITKEEMIKNLNIEIWNFVKRQRTWFKRNKKIVWLNSQSKNLLKQALKIIKKGAQSRSEPLS